MIETVDLRAEDSEQELMERLAALAEQNTSLGTAFEAAQRLVEHRQTVDELIGQAVADAMGLERLQEEVRELEAQREALKEILKQDGEALDRQLQQMTSSLGGVFKLLSNANDSIRELERHLSSLLKRVETVRAGSPQESTVADPSVEVRGSRQAASRNDGQTEDDQAGSPVGAMPELTTEPESVSEGDGPEAGQAQEAEEDSLEAGPGEVEVADAPMQAAADEGDDGLAPRGGEPQGAEKAAPEEQAVIGLQPGQSWVVGTEREKDIDGSTKGQETDKADREDPTSWWGFFRT